MKEINFVGNRKIYFTFSILVLAVSMIFTFVFGVNLDIQFKGGSIITYSYQGEIDKNLFQSTIEEVIGGNVSIQETSDVNTGLNSLKVSLAEAKGIESEKQVELSDKLNQLFADNNIEVTSVNSVDPVIGKEFLAKSLTAVALASLLMIIYIGLRFKSIGGWSAGVMAVVALLHDILVVFATFVIFRYPINDNFIAVILTILGYSLNDTIVIYDRVRENKRLYGSKLGLGELVNKSINQSLTRSIATTVTTMMAMAVVAIVAIGFGVTSIVTFAVPMLVGLISGVYSSICIAGPLYVMWNDHKNKTR